MLLNRKKVLLLLHQYLVIPQDQRCCLELFGSASNIVYIDEMKYIVFLLATSVLFEVGCSRAPTPAPPVASSDGREYECEEIFKERTLELIPNIRGRDIYFDVGFREPFQDQDIWYHCVYQATTWYVVRGKLPNPTFDDKHYWYIAAGKYSTVRALDIPKGKHHFRLCAHYSFSIEPCVRYSNDIEVEIK